VTLNPVFKFGGTSVGTIERIEHVASLIASKNPSAVVVSAMAGETNRLVEMASRIYSRTDVPEYDLLVASGEQVSVSLLCLALRKKGLNPYPMLAPHVGIKTTEQFSNARILSISKEPVLKAISEGFIPVIAGFQGVTEQGFLTSLGRGGSDTSAVAICAAIGAKTCVIYTDVDGVFSADPRICPNAKILPQVGFEEMLEMSSQGSKVLHIRSVHLAAKWGIQLWVKNTFSENEGTVMLEQKTIEGEVVTGVASTTGEIWLRVGPAKNNEFFLPNLFSELADKGVNVDIISQTFPQSHTSENPLFVEGSTEIILDFTISSADLMLVQDILNEKFQQIPVAYRKDVAKVSIVGVGMRTHPGVAATMFKTLSKFKIPVLLVTTSEIKVACLIPKENASLAVLKLHEKFCENENIESAN
jgi:aspartate kinase